MKKKLTTACLALVALAAFALPAAAQAANTPILTEPTGSTIEPNNGQTKVLATNTESSLLKTTTGETKLTCTTVKMTGNLTKNETGNVQGDITSAEFKGTGSEGACTGLFNAVVTPEVLPWCLKSTNTMGEDEFTVSGGSCTEAAKKIKFTLTVFGSPSQKCTYESTSTTAVRGSYTTDTISGVDEGKDAILSTPRVGHTETEDSGFTKVTDDVIFNPCPSSSALKMSLTLETDEPSDTRPIYISS